MSGTALSVLLSTLALIVLSVGFQAAYRGDVPGWVENQPVPLPQLDLAEQPEGFWEGIGNFLKGTVNVVFGVVDVIITAVMFIAWCSQFLVFPDLGLPEMIRAPLVVLEFAGLVGPIAVIARGGGN